eukprot:1113524-Lingulodinium_polyedra.AAC.1
MGKRRHEKGPSILISCPLTRVAVPLGYLVGKMWPEGKVVVRMRRGARCHAAWVARCGIGGKSGCQT